MVESAVQLPVEIVVGSIDKLKIRVLHVDDEASLLKIAKQCLEMQGPFQVDTASSVEEALEKLKKESYDAVVSDYQMAGKDGLEFLKDLRAIGNSVSFVMFTGKGREEVAVKAWNLGADHYVNKNGDPETVYYELAHCLRSAVEKHAAEVQARETTRKLQTIYQNALEGIGYVSPEENFVYVNKAFADILGCEEDRLVGMNLRRFVDEEGWAKIKGETERRRQGKASRYDLVFHRIDGATRNVMVSGSPLFGSDGSYTGTVGIVLDMTDRKKAEDALRASEERHRIISGITAGFVFSCVKKGDGKFTIDWIRGATERILGYSDEEVREKGCWKYVVQKQDLPIFEEKVTGLKPGQSSVCELRITHKDGSTRWIKALSKVMEDISDPANHRLFGAGEDITERKRIEEELRASEEKFKDIFESADDGLVYLDTSGRVLEVNKKAAEIFGGSKEDILGKHFTKIGIFSIKEVPTLMKTFMDVLRSKRAPIEITIKNKKGQAIPLECSASLLKAKGKTTIAVVARDVTEQRKKERLLRENEEKYRELAESISDVFFAIDKDFKYTYWNTASEKLTGIQAKDAIGKSLTEVFPDVKGTKVEQFYRNVMKTNQHQTFVNEHQVGDEGFIFELNAYPTQTGLSVFVKDITERKKREEALRHSEEKYKGLFENAKDVVVLLDLKGNVTSINKAAAEYGFNESEMLGKSMLKFISRRYWPKLLKDVAQLVLGKTAEGRIEIHTPKGDKTAEYRSNPIFSGNRVVGIQTILEDTTELTRHITERNNAEESLRESEERYRDLFENSMDAIVTLDLKGSITAVNSAVLSFGYKKEDLVGKNILDFVSKEYWPAIMRDFSKVTQREPAKNETELIVPAGKILVEYNAGPIVKESNVVGVQINIRDVTERKKNEELVSRSQQKFEGLFMGNPEAAVYLGPDFRIQDINPRFRELFGYSPEEVKGKHINDVIVPNGKMEEAQTLDDQAVKGYACHNTLRKRKDGSLVPVSISAAPVVSKGQLLGYVGMYKDISDLKKAQEESEELRGHFQSLFNLMADPVAIVDGKGKVLDTTSRVHEITGFEKEEIVGKNFLKLKMFSAGTKAAMIKSLAKRMMGMHVLPYEVEIITKDGRKLPHEITAAKIDYKGKPADLVVFHDISERKKLEEKLRIVGSLTRHDVRNKLAAITGNIYINKKKLADHPDILESFNDMQLACEQIVRIFEFARDYERLGAEELAFVDVGTMADKAANAFPDLKGARVVNECHGLAALADSLLERLFYNLIDNSLKYGGKLAQIRIRHEESEDGLRLIYEDDGVGISKDNKTKLFNEGFTTGKGSGYGLYLIKRMMEVYGWTIQETGTPRKGACFTMSIPEKNQEGRENFRLR